ncbi:unnamed protein product [Rotaria magnacalcarata]|uniref:G-protein coupled receptors family 1 profile domain-containing protein n=2 Tax=Rotaria magnacalcarata TaxID=392030 RepID=A0A816S1J8_9BILA|nr:unnamed protein product [Rotaria magnacalcarata]CAF4037084.1 unnamed protein product [Rotaria magnacalcarata]
MASQEVSSLRDLYFKYPITFLSLRDLYTFEVIILLIYGIMIIFSFFTNLIAIIIFTFGHHSRSELSPFLLNLSVFNIIMTVYCMPFTITSLIFQRWLYARELCIVLDVFKTFSVSGVLLTLIGIAIDRYCAVKYPLAIKIYSVSKRNVIALLIIWILSIILAVLWSPARSLPMQQKRLWVNSRSLLRDYILATDNTTDISKSDYLLKNLDYKIVDTIQCVPNKESRPVEVRRTILNFLQTYFFPLFILAFVYLRIAAMLWRRSNDKSSEIKGTAITVNHLFTHESTQFKKKLKQGIKMIIAVVVLYAVLWLPMNVFQLSLNLLCYDGTYYQNFCSHTTLLQLLYIGSHFLTVSNTAINPIIYGFVHIRFRNDIRDVRLCLFRCHRRPSHNYSTRFARTASHELPDRNQDSKLKLTLLSKTTKMNFPTGMSTGTGLHYENVAARMHSYVNHNGGHHLQHVNGGFHQMPVSRGAAYASNNYYGGSRHFGIDPVIANDVNGFARTFMRHLFTR